MIFVWGKLYYGPELTSSSGLQYSKCPSTVIRKQLHLAGNGFTHSVKINPDFNHVFIFNLLLLKLHKSPKRATQNTMAESVTNMI